MRMSQLVSRTQREMPSDADMISQQLLHRAGYLRQLGAGLFSLLPLGLRVMQKLERSIREEMNALGLQEVYLPMVQPAELWQRSGRWQTMDQELLRFKDRLARDYCLAMTHEEAMTHLLAQFVSSYKQLPIALYQFQTKFRDEPRPRAGLIRAREFIMKDAYSFHASASDFSAFYLEMFAAYERIFERCELNVIAVESDIGLMGGVSAHEFMYLSPKGEDSLILCDSCGYKANRQVAVFQKESFTETPLDIEEIATPGIDTIETLASYLAIPKAKTAKAVFFVDETPETKRLIVAMVRGDRDVNETKLAQSIQACKLRPAYPEEIRAIGAEPGYASPIGIQRHGVVVAIDEAVAYTPNLVAGSNKTGYHFLNINHGRDYLADSVADIASAKQGDKCKHCASDLREARAIEVANIFNLGVAYSEAFGAKFLTAEAKKLPLYMGSYGIGLGRLMAVLVEAHHDDLGILWPKDIAPFKVSIIAIKDKQNSEPMQIAMQIYSDLCKAGIEVLFDDRDENPGVKFKDADLLGIPLQIIVAKRNLDKGIVECKDRKTGEKGELKLAELLPLLRTRL